MMLQDDLEDVNMSRIEEIIEQIKEYAGLVEPPKKKCNVWAIVITVLAIIGVIVAVVAILMKYFGPAYFEDFEDDYEDDFDDDFFEDEDDEIEVPAQEEKKESADAE